MTDTKLLVEQIEALENILVARATGGEASERDYVNVRATVLSVPAVTQLVPKFVRTCSSLGQFWGYIGKQSANYAGRREHIWAAFRPVYQYIESGLRTPGDSNVGDALDQLSSDEVARLWQRALDRRATDPEGAITAARTLLESVCKHILEEAGVEYRHSMDLTQLYSLTAQQMKLAPSQHTEQVFKQLLGGVNTVVNGLASIRNRLGDAHGQGALPVRPSARHAELAVNLAGSVAAFLVATWNQRG